MQNVRVELISRFNLYSQKEELLLLESPVFKGFVSLFQHYYLKFSK